MLAAWKSKREPREKSGGGVGSPALNLPLLLWDNTGVQWGWMGCQFLLATSDSDSAGKHGFGAFLNSFKAFSVYDKGENKIPCLFCFSLLHIWWRWGLWKVCCRTYRYNNLKLFPEALRSWLPGKYGKILSEFSETFKKSKMQRWSRVIFWLGIDFWE